MGGKIEVFYHSMGEFDLLVVAEMPDNESMAAIQFAVRSTGIAKDHKVTALLSREDAVNALRRAGGAGYQPPS